MKTAHTDDTPDKGERIPWVSFYSTEQQEKNRSLISFYKTHPSLLIYPDYRSAAPLQSDFLDLTFTASQA